MFSKSKNWISGGLWRPKNPHSLEHLKYLHSVLGKNRTITEHNRSLLVETLRSISEILIWGDQNDSSVFDFFLEKNMLAFFLWFMRQKSGRYICVQLLQTLNILFENISNETSIYYLLSNNHINSIIIHRFDFSDEEVMAYYISFLKTLSLKLNKHTIHFFYNEHTNDFALYTEAIKFFNHSESMVRIAVRTITLNVYKACRYTSQLDSHGQPLVDEKSMLCYIRDKTAAPYFSNLVWFIGNHVLDLDRCVRHDIDHNSRGRLSDLVAEHLDHLHYLNDILCLNIDALNEVLTEHLLHRLLFPLYVYSLTNKNKFAPQSDEKPHVGSVVSLFMLSQVFLIMHHAPLVRQLADIIMNGDISVCLPELADSPKSSRIAVLGFVKPSKPLAETLDQVRGSKKPTKRPNYTDNEVNDEPDEEGNATCYIQASSDSTGDDETDKAEELDSYGSITEALETEESDADGATAKTDNLVSPNQNSTDEEKLLSQACDTEFSLTNRPYLEAIFGCFEYVDSDYEALFALCLLYAVGYNNGIDQQILDKILMPTNKSLTKSHYNTMLVEKLIKIISSSCQNNSRVRLATLELSILLLKTMVYKDQCCYLQDRHLAALEGSREEATLQLRNFYKSEEIFLDMFEDEYREVKNRPLNVEFLTMDASILLPPTGTPLTGIEFSKRLPCGEVEKARRAIRVFFHMRDLSLTLRQEPEGQLPLTKQEECVSIGDILDLNNSDLIACTVIQPENRKERRFLVIDILQLILVEPDSRKLGWGVVKFVGFLQDVEVSGDKEDSRSLHITIHKPATNMHAHPLPLLCARFLFDDHIRCMAAKQRLTKGRLRARQRKMQMIARLLELPTHIVDSMYQPSTNMSSSAATLRTSVSSGAIPGRSHPVGQRSMETSQPPPLVRTHSEGISRSLFSSVESTTTFQVTREQTIMNNTRQLPRHLASKQTRPISIRGARPGGVTRQRPVQDNIQRVMEEAGVDMATTAIESSTEEAEEAAPSPEAHARQSLNPPHATNQTSDVRGRASRSSSTDSNTSHGPHEMPMIPMEDLSKRMRKSQKHVETSGLPQKSSGEHKKSRSGSASPRRARRGSGSSSPRGRSKIPATVSKATAVDDKTLDSGCSNLQADEQEVTSFIKETTHSNQVVMAKRAPAGDRNLSGSGGCPKSLTPALEPSLSLVISCDSPAVSEKSSLGSPKLLPPTDSDCLHNFNDSSASLTESENQALNVNSSQISDSNSSMNSTIQSSPVSRGKLPFTVGKSSTPSVSENSVSIDLSNVERIVLDESASDHLAKLAELINDEQGVSNEPEKCTDTESKADATS